MSRIIVGDEKSYREAKGYNNSLLGAYDKSLKELREYLNIGISKEEKEKKANAAHFRKGSGMDCLLTTPDDFNKKFIVFPKYNEDAQEAILLKGWLAAGKTEWNPQEMEAFSRTLEYKSGTEDKVGLWGNIKDVNKRIDKFDIPFWREKVYPVLRSFKHKTILSEEEYQEVNNAALSLRNDPYTANLFVPNKDEILYTQLSLFREYAGVTLKGMLDLVKVNLKDKTIQPDDVKSTSKSAAEEFSKSFIDFGYIRQAPFYTFLIEDWRDKNYPDFEVLPFRFVVKSLVEDAEPALIFEVSDELMNIGRYGGKVDFKTIKGWEELLAGLIAQEETQQYYLTPAQLLRRINREPLKLEYRKIESNKKSESSAACDFNDFNF